MKSHLNDLRDAQSENYCDLRKLASGKDRKKEITATGGKDELSSIDSSMNSKDENESSDDFSDSNND